MRRKAAHEVGNVYAKAIPNIPSHRWQEWELVKIIENNRELPHAKLREVGGKTVRTLACVMLDDDAVWIRRQGNRATADVAAAG
ncbi:MAG TPA: hypothetical protein VGF92_06155 [Stellaceae bacterium]